MLMETALKREIVRKTGAREIANALGFDWTRFFEDEK